MAKNEKWDPEKMVAKGENPNGMTSVGVFGRGGPDVGMGEQDYSFGEDRDSSFGPYAPKPQMIDMPAAPRRRK